jgi:aminoglycoside phosphotransferase (APT) family kinase protein
LPTLDEREHARTGARLADWLAGTLGAEAEPELLSIQSPPGSGFSGETLLITARWTEAGRRTDRPLVVRCEPRQFRVVPDTQLAQQVRVLRALAEHSRLPVPRLLWYEPDAQVLGTPFLVVDRLPGRTPPDQPPYHEAGWVTELAPAQRGAMWEAGVGTLAEIHAVPLEVAGLELAGDPLGRHLETLERQRDWMPRIRLPLLDEAAGWLWANRPAAHDAPVLLWGDARLGNLLFSGDQVTGVLDWEKAMAGPREFDLAWFLYVDRHHSEGCRLPRLTGFPSAAETIAQYEALTGHQVRDLAYFQVLCGYQFALLMITAISLMISLGRMPEQVGADYLASNSSTVLLRTVLAEAGG